MSDTNCPSEPKAPTKIKLDMTEAVILNDLFRSRSFNNEQRRIYKPLRKAVSKNVEAMFKKSIKLYKEHTLPPREMTAYELNQSQGMINIIQNLEEIKEATKDLWEKPTDEQLKSTKFNVVLPDMKKIDPLLEAYNKWLWDTVIKANMVLHKFVIEEWNSLPVEEGDPKEGKMTKQMVEAVDRLDDKFAEAFPEINNPQPPVHNGPTLWPDGMVW